MLKFLSGLLLFTLAAGVFASVNTKVPCSQIQAPLYYEQYGIATPGAKKGWKCWAVVNAKTKKQKNIYHWEKEGSPSILLAGLPWDFNDLAKDKSNNIIDNPKMKEPYKTVEKYFNGFLGESGYMKNEFREYWVNQFWQYPKAIFFNRVIRTDFSVGFQNG
jgi:hypothetical protein